MGVVPGNIDFHCRAEPIFPKLFEYHALECRIMERGRAKGNQGFSPGLNMRFPEGPGNPLG